jgi:hypothetical protein
MKCQAVGGVLFVVVFCGCSEGSKPYKTAQVSGVITLDGKPLTAARVTFMPVPDAEGPTQSGPESAGDSDGGGRYSLRTVFGDAGASVGKNRVMITTRKTEPDPSNPDKSKEVAKEQVPGKYFTDQAPLFFDVPTSGTKAANFELTTK